MSDFLFNDANFWFSVAIGVVIVLFIIEFIGLVLGVSVLGVFDDISDVDADVDMPADSMTSLASWLSLDKLPLMIWVVIFLTIFGICGYLTNYIYAQLMSAMTPAWLSIAASLVAAVILTARFGVFISRVLPKSESSALEDDDYIGTTANITIGIARQGNPAEAKFTDKFSQPHYVLVEPFEADEQFNQGDRIILVKKGMRSWLATRYR